MSAQSKIYQVKVSLKNSKPPIWRRLLLKDTTTLEELHTVIQLVMGWDDGHLHQFLINGEYYGTPYPEYGEDMLDEGKYTLKNLIPAEKYKFIYEYDFGDSWIHTILVEKILSPEPEKEYPHCVNGKRACPPEDVGGVWGYALFLEAIQDPKHEQHEMFVDWVGDEFDPAYFDVEEANLLLREYA